MFFGKKLKAFSMVELMMVLLISALIIAAIVPIITRKHLQLPTVASHGAYLCYYGPKGIDDATGEITDRTVVLREARWSGSGYSRKVFDRPTANCVFDPPKKAAFFQITAVGGGGGGSDSGYKGSVPTQHRSGDSEFNPFMITEQELKDKEVEYDTFKANAGWVAAFTKSRKSGKGGDMGWYKYQEIFNPGRCIEYYPKIKVQTNVGAEKINVPIHHSQWKKISDGTPGTHGYWEYNGKKYIRENGPEITEDEPCCNDIGAHNDPNNTCWSCYMAPGPCVGGTDKWVWAREVGEEPHYDPDGVTKWSDEPGSGLDPIQIDNVGDGTDCRPIIQTDDRYYWPKCNNANPADCTIVFDYDPCPTVESCPGFSTPDEGIKCTPAVCPPQRRTRPASEMRAPNGGWVSEEIHGVADLDNERCRYRLYKFKKHMVFKPCYGGYYESDHEVCNQIADPNANCPVGTGKYEQICYEYDETKSDGKGTKLSECPSDEGTWTWHDGVAPTSDEWKLEEWDEDNWVDPAPEYEWRCVEVDGESTAVDPSNPTGSCQCKNSTTDEKIITYKRTDSDRVIGGAGGNGVRCATPFVPVDAKENMLKYYDATNLTSGEYSGSWANGNGLSNRAQYGMYFTAEEDGTDGDSINVGGNRTIGGLSESDGWAASSHPGSTFAKSGNVPCAKTTSPYDTKQETSCSTGRKPSWTEVHIEKGYPNTSTYYWTRANSASKGGGPGGRDEYERVSVNGTDGTFIGPDRSETTGHITDVDGNEIVNPVKLNSPNSNNVTSGVNGVCETNPNTRYKNASASEFNEIFGFLDSSAYKDYPYGYILKHKNGDIEFAGVYRAYKVYDSNELAVGVPGNPGGAFTTLKRNIPADERTIVVGVGGSAAGMGTGAAGSPGSKTFMGTLIEVSGGDGGQGISEPRYYAYEEMMNKVYNSVEYIAEDVCYFSKKFSTLPASVTSYMGRNRAAYQSYAASHPGLCAGYTSMSDYKYHILEGAEMGGYPDYVGGIPTFNVEATAPLAAAAFEKAGMGGQGGGVEHFCMTSQKIIVFEDKIDFKASVFREDALNPGTPEYNSLFGSGAPFYGQDAGFSQVIPEHLIPRECYRNEPGSRPAYNHVAAGNGKDGILLIRW